MSSILIFYHFLLFPVRVFVNFGGAHHRIPRCTHIHLHILTQHWLSHTEILFTFIYVYVCLYIVAICKTVPIFIYRFHIWWLFLVLTLALCPCFSSVWLNDVASLFCSVLFLFSIFFFALSDSVDFSICRRTVKCTRMSIHVYDIERLCYADIYWLAIFVRLGTFWLGLRHSIHHLNPRK